MGIRIIVNQVFREANVGTDWLFKFRHSITNSFSFDLCFSPVLDFILTGEIVGRTFVRSGA